MTSWKAEMLVDGEWCANALRFETEDACTLYARDLWTRWTQPTDYRAVECDDAPTLDSQTVLRYEDECDQTGMVIAEGGQD